MLLAGSSATDALAQNEHDAFHYTDIQFHDIQMLRYKVEGFEQLTLKEKTFIYYLQEAALLGRDILFDQNGRYNLRLRHMFETIYTSDKVEKKGKEFEAFQTYLRRLWFSSGIHHHYGCEKFVPGFSEAWLRQQLALIGYAEPAEAQAAAHVEAGKPSWEELMPVIFDPSVMQMRVNQKDGDDLVLTSASNYYAPGITQQEAEEFYAQRKPAGDPRPVMMGMNSRLVRDEFGQLEERVWRVGGLYGQALERIVAYLEKARPYACTPEQQVTIDRLIEYYRTGDLRTFDNYCIHWLRDTQSRVDFVNGFTESYGDPMGLKASWESIVNFRDDEATARTVKLSDNADWFEQNSPVDNRFKKEKCRGVSAKVINAAILGGDLYPSTAIGINLPNSDWVRRDFGSKSVTIGNLTHAYAQASRGSGMDREFVIDQPTRDLLAKYGDLCDDLHTDLHDCLRHGSGRLHAGVDGDSLRSYGSTIEEARADLFGLYYLADPKMLELGLVPDMEAYKSQYYSYMMNGLISQLVRIQPGATIEEAHMRNRALIARWTLSRAKEVAKTNGTKPAVELVKKGKKTYVQVNDYAQLRTYFGELLAEIQRIKSEGDYAAARAIVENYSVQVDPTLHKEILQRYERLHLSPYKGFINPVYTAVRDAQGNITDVTLDYTEDYDAQMLRYSKDYSTLPVVNE